jgi:hypothetical protein
MTTTPHDAPLPAEAHVLSDWQETDSRSDLQLEGLPLKCRVISTDAKGVDLTVFFVSAVATQLADGSIEVEDFDGPLVLVDELDESGTATERLTVSPGAARNLARALIDAADQVDGWTS